MGLGKYICTYLWIYPLFHFSELNVLKEWITNQGLYPLKIIKNLMLTDSNGATCLGISNNMPWQDNARNNLHLTQLALIHVFFGKLCVPQSIYGNNHWVLLCFSCRNLQAEKASGIIWWRWVMHSAEEGDAGNEPQGLDKNEIPKDQIMRKIIVVSMKITKIANTDSHLPNFMNFIKASMLSEKQQSSHLIFKKQPKGHF